MEIKDLIYNIRGKQVMLDSDVAKLYNYETKYINRTVKRNIVRFPERYCFQLTKAEYDFFEINYMISSRCQFGTLKNNEMTKRGSNVKYLPFVFTERGISMLSGLLKNEVAVQVSINIIDAFVDMRKFITNNAHFFERLTNVEYKLLEHDEKFDLLFNELQKDDGFKQKVFFDGQIFDAHSLIIKIIKGAKKERIIIDNYIDINTLDILSKKKHDVKIILITRKENTISENDIIKLNEQYPKLEVLFSAAFHDRFIILDKSKIYHIGASLKDAGKKCFGINLIKETIFINQVMTFLEKGYYYHDL